MNSLTRMVVLSLAAVGLAAFSLTMFDGKTSADASTNSTPSAATITAAPLEMDPAAFVGPPFPDPFDFMGPPYPETEEDKANQTKPAPGWVAAGDGC